MDDHMNRDTLDSLLDNLTNDDTMERKIDEFSAKKQLNERIQRARRTSAQFQETYATRKPAEEEIVLDGNDIEQDPESDQIGSAGSMDEPGSTIAMNLDFSSRQANSNSGYPGNSGYSSNSGYSNNYQNRNAGSSRTAQNGQDPNSLTRTFTSNGAASYSGMDGAGNDDPISKTIVHNGNPADRTMVYHTGGAVRNQSGSSDTLIMDEQEIQNMLNEDEPLLKREYVQTSQNRNSHYETMDSERHHFSWKIPAAILGVVLVVVVVLAAVPHVSSFIQDVIAQKQTNELTNENFERLMAWVKGYTALSDDDKKDILQLESLYNHLNEEQQQQINDILIEQTGKNFDELLASAAAGDKQDSSNNNTQIAEQKAQLKDDIADLNDQVAYIQGTLDQMNSEINNAYNDWQSKLAAQTASQQTYDQAKKTVDDLNASFQSDTDRLKSEVDSLNNQLKSAQDSQAKLQSQLDAEQAKLKELEAAKDSENSSSSSDSDSGSSGSSNSSSSSSSQNAQAIQTCQDNINKLQGQIADQQKTIDDLNGKIAENQKASGELSTNLDQATQAMNDAQNTLNAATQAASESESYYNSIKNNGDGLQAQINDLNSQIAQKQSELDSLN